MLGQIKYKSRIKPMPKAKYNSSGNFENKSFDHDNSCCSRNEGKNNIIPQTKLIIIAKANCPVPILSL